MKIREKRTILENASIKVDVSKYEKMLRELVDDYAERAIEDRNRDEMDPVRLSDVLSAINSTFQDSESIKKLRDEPDNWNVANDVYKKLFKQYRDNASSNATRDNMKVFDTLRLIRKYVESLTVVKKTDSEIYEDYDESYQTVLKLTRDNIKLVTDIVSSATKRVKDWNVPVTIEISLPSKANELDLEHGESSFQVSVGKRDISFTLFLVDGKIEIGDELEGGDDDFFDDPTVQHFYFSLINEIRKPGSSSIVKFMTLYTARPVKDRKRYIGAKDVPINIFLSSSLDDAEGLATDLAGSGKRDLYKVVIEQRYLVQTLEGRIKHYQTIGSGKKVPVKKIELLIQGE